jgi:hypothetical protein
MPFKSEAQRRYMFAKHKDIAERWAHKYPKSLADLPQHVAKNKTRRKKRG